MHLIIDGYNLIRQSIELQLLDAREMEAGRRRPVGAACALRERSRHKITVVFDGWLGGDLKETRDRQAGILIIYSRLGEKADEVIKRLLTTERQRAVVVTSDREIQTWAQEVGATWITAPQFEMQYLLARPAKPGMSRKKPVPAARRKARPIASPRTNAAGSSA